MSYTAQKQIDIIKKSYPLLVIILVVGLFYLILPVNPWPIDGWYLSKDTLFSYLPNEDNYTPVAVPAYVYRSLYFVGGILGVSETGQFYLAAFFQYLILFVSMWYVYRTLSLIYAQKVAFGTTLVWLVFVLIKGLPMAFWSENIMLFLMSLTVYLSVNGLVDSEKSPYGNVLIFVFLSFSIGLMATTRITPILIIPLLLVVSIGRYSVRRLSLVTGAMLVLSLLMLEAVKVQNLFIFERYEVSNSIGRHLWQGVSPLSTETGIDSVALSEFRERVPEIDGLNWWEVFDKYKSVYPARTEVQFEDELKVVALDIIYENPNAYISLGVKKFIKTVARGPFQLGYSKGTSNPLNTDEMLEAPIEGILGKTYIIDRLQTVHRVADYATYFVYPVVIAIILCFSFGCILKFFGLFSNATPVIVRSLYLSICMIFTSLIIEFPEIVTWSGPIQFWGKQIYSIYIKLFVLGCLFMFNFWLFFRYTKKKTDVVIFSHSFLRLYVFCFVLFFGTLLISWQLETNVPRYMLPLIPGLCVLTGSCIHAMFINRIDR